MTAEPAVPKQWDRSEGARRDIVAGGIVVAAILLFIGNGGAVMQSVIRTLSGLGGGTDRMLAVALILNIALLLFGWRRYDDLNREVSERTQAAQPARWLADTDPLPRLPTRRQLPNAGQALTPQAPAKGPQVSP